MSLNQREIVSFRSSTMWFAFMLSIYKNHRKSKKSVLYGCKMPLLKLWNLFYKTIMVEKNVTKCMQKPQKLPEHREHRTNLHIAYHIQGFPHFLCYCQSHMAWPEEPQRGGEHTTVSFKHTHSNIAYYQNILTHPSSGWSSYLSSWQNSISWVLF